MDGCATLPTSNTTTDEEKKKGHQETEGVVEVGKKKFHCGTAIGHQIN